MDGTTVLWIVIALVVVTAIALIASRMSKQRRLEAQRGQATEIREEAREHDRELREREASAQEADAQAARARAEAQEREAEAKRLETVAERRSESAAGVRSTRDEHLRQADSRDPDVLTDDEGYRVDEEGNRIGGDRDTIDRADSDKDRAHEAGPA